MGVLHSVVVTDPRYFSEVNGGPLKGSGSRTYINSLPGARAKSFPKLRKQMQSLRPQRYFLNKFWKVSINANSLFDVGVGIDNIDVKAATEKGILVAYLPDFYIEDVSNHIMALILGSSRKITFTDRLVRDGKCSFNKIQPIKQLKSKVLGLVGFGKISSCLLPKLKPFNFQVLVYDPYISILPREVEKVDLLLYLDAQTLLS